MKTAKVTLTILTMSALLVGTNAHAGDDFGSGGNIRPKSLKVAKRYSLWGTLLPVTAGIVSAMADNSGKEFYDQQSGTYIRQGDSGEKTATILMLSGVIIGPSLGYFYGGCPGRGARGLAIRVGTGMATGLLAASIASSYESKGWGDVGGVALALAVIGIGAGLIIYDAVIDIAHVKDYVELNNINRARETSHGISLAPIYRTDSGAAGLQFNYNF